MEVYGKILEMPKLRFDYSSGAAQDVLPKRGLSRFGPYDSSLIGKNAIKSVIFFPEGLDSVQQILVEGLTEGEGSFRGFVSLFKIPLEFTDCVSFSSSSQLNLLLDKISVHDPDIVYVVLTNEYSHMYSQIKLRLFANGIPSQIVTVEKISEPRGRQYILENISLATYAKIGGTPWTVSTTDFEDRLVLGVSRAQDYARRYFVGFVVLFTNEGDFLFVNSKAPVVEWEKYVQGLTELIEEAIVEYENEIGMPSSIVVHFHKLPGKKEIEAIERALKNMAKDIPYAIVHINEYSNFRLFDSSHFSYVPPKGLCVRLSQRESLILVDGRVDGRYKVGMPRVLDVKIDKRSTLDPNSFEGIFEQVYRFSYVNWRGFNAANLPVTLNYSKLIAQKIVEVGVNTWNQAVPSGRLRDKAWFL